MGKDTIKRIFKESQIESIAKILGNTLQGLSGSEIGHFLSVCGIEDPNPDFTKWKRLYNAFVGSYNKYQCGNKILSFIAKALAPERFVSDIYQLKLILIDLNKLLLFVGLEFRDDGKFYNVERVASLSEAEQRANNLSSKVLERGMHKDLLKYCRAELLENNYFHAVLEASKGIFELIRKETGLVNDGAELVKDAFSGDEPKIKINSFITDTHKAEQRGFGNLLIGLYGTFRTPQAHATKINWEMSEQDALDFFSLASYMYRRIYERVTS